MDTLFSDSLLFLGMRATTVLILLCVVASLYAWTAKPATVQNDLVFSLNNLRFSFLLLMPVGLVAVLYFLYNAVAVYYHLQSNVAYISHIIGFSLGPPLGIAWSPQWKRNLLISIGLLVAYFAPLFFITTYVLPSVRW